MKLTNIQNLPYPTRVKILWGLSALVTVGLITIWTYSAGQQVKNVNLSDISGNPLPPPPTSDSVAAVNKYTNVEWIERKDQKLLIYFKVNNDSTSILNFSKTDKISLTVNGQTQLVKNVTDRQGQPFVQKILSNTQNFGIAEFEDKNGTRGEIKFDGLVFENNLTETFYETINLDFDKLTKTNL